MKNIEQAVIHIVAEKLGFDDAQVKPESLIVDDLGADSLDCVELVMLIEEGFEIEISDEDAERVKTVLDAINLVKKAKDPSLVPPPAIVLPKLKHTWLTMKVSDGSTWGVPVLMIARNRAAHYAHEFDGSIERSMAEDTIPLFNSSDYEIEDWAVNNMNWSDFNGHQKKLMQESGGINFQEAWLEAEKCLQ